MSFDPSEHPRDTDGKFAEKTGALPEVSLDGDILSGKTMDDYYRSDGLDLSQFIIEDEEEDDEPYDASRKFSSLRSYPGMNGASVDADLLYGKTMDDLNGCGETGDVLFFTEDGYEIQEATDGYAAYDADGNFITSISTASDDHDSIEDAFREQMAELKAAGGE